MDTFLLERIQGKLVMFCVIAAGIIFAYVVFGVEYLMNTALLFPLHDNFDIFRLDLIDFCHLILAFVLCSNFQLLLEKYHAIFNLLFDLFKGMISLIIVPNIFLIQVNSFPDIF